MRSRRCGHPPPPARVGGPAGVRDNGTRKELALLLVTLLLLVGIAAGEPVAPGARSSPSPPLALAAGVPLSANISAVPSAGAAPLVVTFTTEVTGGAGPYRYSWSFGDGNASAAADPTHAYEVPGEYVASLMVTDSLLGTTNASQTIVVSPAVLTISLAASGAGTDATLTTTFWANVTGGVAPFLFVWEFGDGSGAIGTASTVVHAYHGAGTYAMTVRVTDGDGLAAAGAQQVNFHPVGTTGFACGAWPAGCGPFGLPLLGWLLVALTAIVVVGAGGVRGFRTRRRAPLRPGGETPVLPPTGGIEPRADPTPVPSPELVPNDPVDTVAAPSGTDSTTPGPPANGQPLSARILLHLYRQGLPDPNRVVPVAFTQEGMSVALGRPQSAFARALLRLEEAGLVRSELAHVQGRPRRAKTYR
ncbi:MAG TPA: PKD domain-containing protein, partial [Thermoplasmata archaeon]|nr:PKD domain-containing protein [Thermoplasmata archaeon]